MQTLNPIQNVVILGTGNVATHLSEALLNAGYSVLQLWKRGDVLIKEADLYFIAVSDDAIEEVAKLIPEHKMFAHTSGSVDLSRGGVFYPLQTFSKQIEVDWKNIPILIEYNDTDNVVETHGRASLQEIAKKISTNVQIVNTEKRRQIHLSAVFACNFANHLWTISADLLIEKNLSFDLLKPLIYQTVQKIRNYHPKDVQTGPAVRNDLKTLEKHQNLLSKFPKLWEIYNNISKSIQITHDSH
ncbi:MAG: DUF2520 domain-containing protein [Bacteroidales bacterium]|jgi:predicted short-subunit dehydrogenase-like oxidoreductase (DUF2520 family)|nr:DUF2520 domain-containing protein [Bacteroidales bacterium]